MKLSEVSRYMEYAQSKQVKRAFYLAFGFYFESKMAYDERDYRINFWRLEHYIDQLRISSEKGYINEEDYFSAMNFWRYLVKPYEIKGVEGMKLVYKGSPRKGLKHYGQFGTLFPYEGKYGKGYKRYVRDIHSEIEDWCHIEIYI